MAVTTLGSPSFDPTPLVPETDVTSGTPITVVSGSTSTAMVGETDPVFSAWDKSTGIYITSSQIIADSPDDVPTGLSCSSKGLDIALGSGQSAYVIITWTSIGTSTFAYYNIRYKKTSGTYYSYVTSYVNTITINGLVPNTSYDFGIESVNKQGTHSGFSSNITVTTSLDSSAPATVSGVVATAAIQSVVLTWSSNTEIDLAGYNIYRNTADDSGGSSLINTTFATKYVDGGVIIDQEYFYWLKAKDTSGNLSTNFSTVVSATASSVTESDILSGSIAGFLAALKDNLAAINPTTGVLNPSTVGTLELQLDSIKEDHIQNYAITAAKTSLLAINPTTGKISDNEVGTAQIDTDAIRDYHIYQESITSNKLGPLAVLEGHIYTGAITTNKIASNQIIADHIQSGAITTSKLKAYNFIVDAASDAFTGNGVDTISWTGITVYYEGEKYEISDGSTTDLWVYWEYEETSFSTKDSLPDLDNDDFLVAWNDDGDPALVWNATSVNGNRITTGSIVTSHMSAGSIDADRITAGSITALQIKAGEITADKLKVYNFMVINPSVFANNDPAVGEISWTGAQVSYNGTIYNITNDHCDALENYIYWQPSLPNVLGHSANLPVLVNEYFLVGTNGNFSSTGYSAGTMVWAWNSTVIDGNRITTGSIYTDLLAANCITANQINADAVTADKILAGSVTADKLTVIDLSAITANMGSLTSGSIVIGTTNKIWLNSGNDGDLCIGGTDKATAPFRVTEAGVLTAESGTVGGWNIDDNYIWYGTKCETDGYSASAGSITLKSDGSLHSYNFYINADGETSFKATTPQIDGISTIVLEIGDWDMDSTTNIDVIHGLSNEDIRGADVVIRSDDTTYHTQYNLLYAGFWWLSNTGVADCISLQRNGSGFFDSNAFDSTSFNRGWITIRYEA